MSVLVALVAVAIVAGVVAGVLSWHWPDLAVRAAALLAVAGAVVAVLMLAMYRQEWGIGAWDIDAARWASDHATELSTDVLLVVTDLGDSTVVFVLAGVLALVELLHRRRPALLAFLLVAVGGQSILVGTLKWLVGRDRPDIDPLSDPSGASFPSGHSATAAAAWAAFALVLGRGRGRPVTALLAAGAAAVAAAVAATRVLLGVHWLTDVVAGLALGWAWVALSVLVLGDRWLRGPAEDTEETRSRAAASDG